MNSGKICIPVCEATADDTIAAIRRAAELADIVEIRFDCLIADQLHRTIKALPDIPATYLFTHRPSDQGGARDMLFSERLTFWQSILNERRPPFIIDLEADVKLTMAVQTNNVRRIVSYHDLVGGLADPEHLFECVNALDPDIIKLAVWADDITDAIPVWKLIERARSENREIIAIAMGEAGKWTRILGPAHGAFLTFASLDTGKETAGGQITAKDMLEVYRVRELDRKTGVYGVIGDPVSQSLSPYMQNAAFHVGQQNAVFMHLLVKDLDDFIRRMVKPDTREVELNFGGFSVTMPHKQAIMRHLDEIDPTAASIGAVNTVKIDADGRMTGFNTDTHGFITPLKTRFGDLRGARAAVFGAGGAARACVYALKREGADVSVYVRDTKKASVFSDEMNIAVSQMSKDRPGEADIVVNATPIGMKGAFENETLFTADELLGVKFVFDLVTKTAATPLISEAAKAGIPAIGGIEMLIAQGARQFEIWTGRDAPIETMRAAIADRMK